MANIRAASVAVAKYSFNEGPPSEPISGHCINAIPEFSHGLKKRICEPPVGLMQHNYCR